MFPRNPHIGEGRLDPNEPKAVPHPIARIGIVSIASSFNPANIPAETLDAIRKMVKRASQSAADRLLCEDQYARFSPSFALEERVINGKRVRVPVCKGRAQFHGEDHLAWYDRLLSGDPE